MNVCSGQISEMKMKYNFKILKRVVHRSLSEACRSKKCTVTVVILFSNLLF